LDNRSESYCIEQRNLPLRVKLAKIASVIRQGLKRYFSAFQKNGPDGGHPALWVGTRVMRCKVALTLYNFSDIRRLFHFEHVPNMQLNSLM
jgi:hypothetical protein